MDTAITVSIITSVIGPTAVVLAQRRDMKRRVGTPNGDGTLTEMSERLLEGQSLQDERLGRLEGRLAGVEVRLADLEHRQVL